MIVKPFKNEPIIDFSNPEIYKQQAKAIEKIEKQFGGTATNIAYNLSQALKISDYKVDIKPLSTIGKDGKDFLRPGKFAAI